MTASCIYRECSWQGSSNDVANANGKCPRCDGDVRYDFKPLEATTIRKPIEFAKRAYLALTSGVCALTEWDEGFLKTIRSDVEHYEQLPDNQQRNLLRMVMRHESSIADKAVITFAINHAPRLSA